jgi:hypothetical protein
VHPDPPAAQQPAAPAHAPEPAVAAAPDSLPPAPVAPSPHDGPSGTQDVVIHLDVTHLKALAHELRDAGGELRSVAVRLGTVREGLGLSSAMQGLVHELAGRQATSLQHLADELSDEARDLETRAARAEHGGLPD